MSWHISSVISKDTEERSNIVTSYVHLFNSCTQDWFAVVSIVRDGGTSGDIQSEVVPDFNESTALNNVDVRCSPEPLSWKDGDSEPKMYIVRLLDDDMADYKEGCGSNPGQ